MGGNKKISDKGQDPLCLRLNASSRTVDTRPVQLKANELIVWVWVSAVSHWVQIREVNQNRKTICEVCGIAHKHCVPAWVCGCTVINTWTWPQNNTNYTWTHTSVLLCLSLSLSLSPSLSLPLPVVCSSQKQVRLWGLRVLFDESSTNSLDF